MQVRYHHTCNTKEGEVTEGKLGFPLFVSCPEGKPEVRPLPV
jgi:hypothetical protein